MIYANGFTVYSCCQLRCEKRQIWVILLYKFKVRCKLVKTLANQSSGQVYVHLSPGLMTGGYQSFGQVTNKHTAQYLFRKFPGRDGNLEDEEVLFVTNNNQLQNNSKGCRKLNINY